MSVRIEDKIIEVKLFTYCTTRDEIERKESKETISPNQALVNLKDFVVEENDRKEVTDY